MSFESELLDLTGSADDAYDIRAVVRRCFFYDFDGIPVRLWDGQGVLVAGGYDWLGTVDADGTNHHQAPTVRDSRDGTSPRYDFRIPYLDRDTFNALKADQALAKGREMTCYHALFQIGDGLRPSAPLRFAYRMLMRGTEFSEEMQGEPGDIMVVRSAAVICRSLEYGRSRIPNGTYTDTAQRERARLLGITADSGCSFVAANSRRTYVIGK